jgi:NNP family nitrate/nitrite transporter-like MFS transporter
VKVARVQVATGEAVIRSSRQQALWIATLGFFGGFAGVSIFGPLVPKFKDLLGLSPFAAALLAAIPSLIGSILRIPFGAMVDRMGGKRPFLILMGITNVGVIGLLVLLATRYPDDMGGTYPILLLLGALIGCGIATFAVGIAQVSYWFPHRQQGGALGVYGGLGNTSPGLSTLVLPIAVGGMGIVSAYSVWFGILAAITIVYLVFIRDAPVFQLRQQGIEVEAGRIADFGGGETVPAGSATAGLKRAAGVPATWMLVFFYFLSFGGFLAFTAWLPTFYKEMYGESLRMAAVLTALFSLLSAGIRVPGGLLSDRLSIRYALVGNFALMLAGTVVLSFTSTLAISFGATLAIAAGMGLQNAIVFKLLPRFVPEAVGGASGWIGGLGAFGGFAIPPIFGAVTGALSGSMAYAHGFLPFAGLIVVAFPVVAVLNRWSARHGHTPVAVRERGERSPASSG